MTEQAGSALSYGYEKRLRMSYDDTVARVKDELKKEGFGVMTEIDVKAKMQEKLGAEFRKYVILGACNPQLAYEALEKDLSVGLLLPCNVVVYEVGENTTVVNFINPRQMVETTHNQALAPIAKQADDKLRSAFERLS